MQAKQIKLLDCTLRDGGYVNNWHFGEKFIEKIISDLINSKIDFIEVGYLRDDYFSDDYSLFSIQNNFLKYKKFASKIAFMIDFEKINQLNLFKNIEKFKDFTLRIAFKRPNLKNALDFSKKLVEAGCNISLNPMHTINYSEDEIDYLIKKTNEIMPSSIVIVDTNGQMIKNDILYLSEYFDKNLKSEIILGFHSHNNLDLSYENAKIFLENLKNRDIILDASLYGMGRGAGNLKTEEIVSFLNEKHKKEYKINIIKELIKTFIFPIYQINPWFLTEQHKIVAINKCHPNYASYFLKNNIDDINFCEYVLKNIPKNYKDVYNEELISQICKCGV
ncbi:MAG: hypothetical protein IKL52_00765 [Candidatus Gastranaerophilales bacterium]|nr:hypothetical protein [Candidatus Gastranaerophilales bacterium]